MAAPVDLNDAEKIANPLTSWLFARFPEVTATEFYRDLFPLGSLASADDFDLKRRGAYNAVLTRVLRGDDEGGDSTLRAERHLVLDDLRTIETFATIDGVVPGTTTLVSPVSYAGRRPLLNKAHELFALTFDLDGVLGDDGMSELFHQFETPWFPDGRAICPRPTYVVSSGHGLHLYYMLNNPLRMWPNVCERLRLMRNELTRQLWNRYVTGLYKEPQLESVVQCFRMVGSLGKDDEQVVRAFRVGDRISIDRLNAWVSDDAKITPEMREARHTIEEARELWPDWDPDWRVKAAAPPADEAKWHVKRDLYDWWCRHVEFDAPRDGNRYWCLFAATAYATKCDVPFDELSAWAYSQLPRLESLTTNPKNHFTAEDVENALSIYRNPISCKLRRDKIAEKTGFPMPVNKRNGKKQRLHLRIARSNLKILSEDAGHALQGRPKGSGTKANLIRAYAAEHPEANHSQIAEALHVSRPTVIKWLKTGWHESQ